MAGFCQFFLIHQHVIRPELPYYLHTPPTQIRVFTEPFPPSVRVELPKHDHSA